MRSRREFIKTTAVGGAAGLASLAGCTSIGGGGGGTPTITFHFVVPVENVASLLGISEIRAELPNVGDVYEIEVNRDSGTPTSVNAMASGDADIVMTSTVSYASAVINEAVPGGVSAIGTDFYDAHPEHYAITVFAGPDTGIEEVADLEGKKLAVNATGTGIHAVYVKALRDAGLSRDDVDFVETGFPTFNAALKEGKVDAGVYPAFFAGGARAEGFTKVYDSGEYWDPYPFVYATASKNSLDEKPDAMRAWTEDYAQLFEYARNNRSEVVSLAADHFEIPEAPIDGFFLTENDYFRDVETDMDRLQTIVDELQTLGFIDSSFDVGNHATNEYLP